MNNTMISHHCSICGNEVEEFCAEHPNDIVDSIMDVRAVAHVGFGLGMPSDSTVEVWHDAGAIGLSVALECPNTLDALAALSDALRRTVVEVDEQRELVASILAELELDRGER